MNRPEREQELMREILTLLNEKKRISEPRLKSAFAEEKDTDIEDALKRLADGQLIRKTGREKPYYSITHIGTALFQEQDKESRIKKKIKAIYKKEESKPWEKMLEIIFFLTEVKEASYSEIRDHLESKLQEKVPKPTVYRYIEQLRMKDYIEIAKYSVKGENTYRLAEKGTALSMKPQSMRRWMISSSEWDEISTSFLKESKSREERFLEMIEESSSLNLREDQKVWILYVQGRVLEIRNRMIEASTHFMEMQSIAETLDDERAKFYATKGMGRVEFSKKEYDRAITHYEIARKIAEHMKDTLLQSDALNNIGSCLFMKLHVDEAVHKFQEALELSGDDTLRKASTLYNLGLCYARKEDFLNANRMWLKALSLFQKMDNQKYIHMISQNLGFLKRTEEFPKQLEVFKGKGDSQDEKKREDAYKKLCKFIFAEAMK